MRHRGPPVKIAPGPLPFNPALITAVGCCFLCRIRTPNVFVRRYSNSGFTSNRYVTCFWLHAQVYWIFFVVYLNIIERSSQLRVLLESY